MSTKNTQNFDFESGPTVSITGRNVTVPEHFAERTVSKLERVAKLDPTITHFDVELSANRNPRRSDTADKVQITARGAGKVARAEAREESFYTALDIAQARLENALRKTGARKHIAKKGHRVPPTLNDLDISDGAEVEAMFENAKALTEDEQYANELAELGYENYQPGTVVRSKSFTAEPMSVDQALENLELLGHDFYLFINNHTQKPSVVYVRKGYDYGLIDLE